MAIIDKNKVKELRFLKIYVIFCAPTGKKLEILGSWPMDYRDSGKLLQNNHHHHIKIA